MATWLEARQLRVGTLVNNAGVGVHGSFAPSNFDAQRLMLRLNVEALTELTHRLITPMVERGIGRVLNVSSVAAFQPGPYAATYHASKSYVLSFSEGLGAELRGTGVTVTALCPGPVDTPFVAEMHLGRLQRLFLLPPDRVARIGYRAMLRGRAVVVPGLSARFMVLGSRLAPRPFLNAVTARQMGQAAGERGTPRR